MAPTGADLMSLTHRTLLVLIPAALLAATFVGCGKRDAEVVLAPSVKAEEPQPKITPKGEPMTPQTQTPPGPPPVKKVDSKWKEKVTVREWDSFDKKFINPHLNMNAVFTPNDNGRDYWEVEGNTRYSIGSEIEQADG